MRLFFNIVAMLCIFVTSASACTDPTGSEGEMVYNSSYKVMQFCNGTDWISMASGYPNAGGVPNAVLEDQKSSGTNGGDATSGSWQTRDLNTEVYDPDDYITLSGNAFTPSVDGWVEWSAPAFEVTRHKARLYNVTDSAIVNYGSSEYSRGGSSSDSHPTTSVGGGAVVAGKTYRIEHRVASTKTNDGYGIQSGTVLGTVTEVYTRVKFWRK